MSNASFIPTRLYRNTRKHGGRYPRGVHNVLLAEGALPIVMKMTTAMMMRVIAMTAMTTADTIERAIAMNHKDENGTNLPRHCDTPPCAQATTTI